MCSQIVKTSSVQRSLLVTSNSAHESDLLVALRRATSQRPDLQFELTYLDLSPTLDFFLNILQPRSSPFRLFYRGVHCTSSEHLITRSSLLKSWATATQIQTAPARFS